MGIIYYIRWWFCVLISVFFISGTAVFSQKPDSYIKYAKGTGETTGHIATLTVENTGSGVLDLRIGPLMIPESKNFQGYIVPDQTDIQVGPGQISEVPLYGFCTNIYKPPVPEDTLMNSFDGWTSFEPHIGSFDSNYFSPGDPGVSEGNKQEPSIITYPGTDIVIDEVVEIHENPEQTGPLLLEVIESIGHSYDSLTATGTLNVTIPMGAAGRRESFIQQTFWIYTAELEGNPYTIDDFHTVVINQFENYSGRAFEELPEDDQDELKTGANSLWEGFKLVGSEAKIFRNPEDRSGPGEYLEIDSDPITQISECDCRYARIKNINLNQNGEAVQSRTLLPGNYQLTAEIESDCPAECQLTVDGKWLVTFIPADGAAVLEIVGEGQNMDLEILEKGRIVVQFRATVLCNGGECPIETPLFHDEYVFDPCLCSDCQIVDPIRIFNVETGEEITGDSIPWGLRISVHLPTAQSDCPHDCNAEENVAIHWQTGYQYREGTSAFSREEFTVSTLHPGFIHLLGICHCNCEEHYCGYVTDSRFLQLYETNDCCDRIRNLHNGKLLFSLANGQSVEIYNNQMIVKLNPGIEERITFDFNIEALFCNMEEGQLFGYLEVQSASSTRNDDITEVYNSSDLTMEYYTKEDVLSPSYTLSYSSSVNGKEFRIDLDLDERTCNIDIAVFYDGEYIETEGPPNFSPAELEQLMDEYSSQHNYHEITHHRFMSRMFQIYIQLLKGMEQGRYGYRDALINWMVLLDLHTEWMLEDGVDNPELEEVLEELADVLDDSPVNYMDILFALLDVTNAMHQF